MNLLNILLIGAMAAAVVSFAVIGLSHASRSRYLARQAHEIGLRFEIDDIFDIPNRYGQFALIRCAHSAQATNVTHGRHRGLPVRAFDFCYEIGHGTQRTTRNYWVIIVHSNRGLPPLTMWNHLDSELSPLEARGSADLEAWSCTGGETAAKRVATALAPISDEGASIQAVDKMLMLCLPHTRRQAKPARYLDAAVAAVEALAEP